jgi:4'-phosphopantetheinyl transferase
VTRVILAHADALRRDAAAEGVAFLSPAEAQRWRSFSRPERREQYRLGRWLLRRALLDQIGGRPQDWRIAAEGPPLARHARGWKAPWLSLSHSGPWFAAALSLWGPVGVDLEQRGQRRPWKELAQHQGWRLDLKRPEASFLRQWTRFEAAYKAPASRRVWSLTGSRYILSLADPGGPGPRFCFLGLSPRIAGLWMDITTR